jgi:hypothetical protein
MARWTIRVTEDGGQKTIEHLGLSGYRHACGCVDACVPDEEVLLFVLRHAVLDDEIVLSCGSVLRLLSTGLRVVSLRLPGGGEVDAACAVSA